MSARSISAGLDRRPPPIFGQSAGAAITLCRRPLPPNGAKSEAIIAKPGSGIASVADLAGGTVGVWARGRAHNLLVAAVGGWHSL